MLWAECMQVRRTALAPAGFICRCSAGWSGDRCLIENACVTESHNCGANSYCYNDGGTGTVLFSCPCLTGYQRQAGSDDSDDCVMIDLCETTSPCRNGAVCLSSLDTYECTCRAGFAGDQCELEVDGCEFNRQPCGVFGECQSDWGQPNGYRCSCFDSYTGTNCNIPPADICDALTNPCQNGAECQSQGGPSYACVCLPGWSGDNCADFVDLCQNAPCGVHGRCDSPGNAPGSFTCQCLDGFTGETCATPPIAANDVCTSAPCQNGANCEEEQDSYECYCVSGFEGPHCEVDIDECACADLSGDLRAISPFTAGLDCATMVSVVGYDCAGSLGPLGDSQNRNLAQLCAVSCDACGPPCGDHGDCTDAVNSRRCTCTDAWTQSADCSGDDCPCSEPPRGVTPPPPVIDPCMGVTCPAAECKVAGVCQGGVCSAQTDAPDSTPCDDQRVETSSDQCRGGVCIGQERTTRPPPAPVDRPSPPPTPGPPAPPVEVPAPPVEVPAPPPPPPVEVPAPSTVVAEVDELQHLQGQVRSHMLCLPSLARA